MTSSLLQRHICCKLLLDKYTQQEISSYALEPSTPGGVADVLNVEDLPIVLRELKAQVDAYNEKMAHRYGDHQSHGYRYKFKISSKL